MKVLSFEIRKFQSRIDFFKEDSIKVKLKRPNHQVRIENNCFRLAKLPEKY